jgi:hypothetical protein
MHKRMAAEWSDRNLAQYMRNNPNASEASQSAAKEMGEKQGQRLVAFLDQPDAALNPSDKQRLAHFHKRKVFSPTFHPDVYKELRDLGMNPIEAVRPVAARPAGGVWIFFHFASITDILQKLSLMKLGQYNPFGAEECFLSVLKEWGVIDEESTDIVPETGNEMQRAWMEQGKGFTARLGRVEEVDDNDEEERSVLEEPAEPETPGGSQTGAGEEVPTSSSKVADALAARMIKQLGNSVGQTDVLVLSHFDFSCSCLILALSFSA